MAELISVQAECIEWQFDYSLVMCFSMDVFSLEDDDWQGLFITQSDRILNENSSQRAKILPKGDNFASSCVSLVTQNSQ